MPDAGDLATVARAALQPPFRQAALSVAAVSLLVTRAAHAGNDDAVLLGNQATLTGGAVTAIVSDGASAWFNPAGLGHATRNQLDVNGRAYGINIYHVKSLFVLPNGDSADAKFTDWVLVPSVLSYARELSDDLVIALGLFIPRTNDFELRTGIKSGLGQTFAATLSTVLNEYDYTLTLAKRLEPNLRCGATLAGIYLSRRDFAQIAAGTPGAVGESFYNGSSFTTEGDYGLRLTLGVQWEPEPHWALGASLQSPIFTGWSAVNRTQAEAALSPISSQGGLGLEGQQGSIAVWDFTTPARLRLGVAYRFGSTQLLLDGDVSTPVTIPAELPDATFYDRDWMGNVRVGVLHGFSPVVTAGGGLFSDLSGRKHFRANFAGVAFGIELQSQHTTDENTRELTLSTTFGARYAFGWGEVRGVGLSLDGPNLVLDPIASEVWVNELALNLGGGIEF